MHIDITLKELKEIAKEQGIKGYSKLTKEQLIAEVAKLEMNEKNQKKQKKQSQSKSFEKKGKIQTKAQKNKKIHNEEKNTNSNNLLYAFLEAFI